jgi:hypothetical protein
MFRRLLLQDLYRVRGKMFGPLHKVGLASHIRNGNWVCAILGEAKGNGFTANPHSTMSSPVSLLPQWFTGFHMVIVISLPVIPRK